MNEGLYLGGYKQKKNCFGTTRLNVSEKRIIANIPLHLELLL